MLTGTREETVTAGAVAGRHARRSEHHQVWFGDRARPLYGWLSVPADRLTRGAVLLCPPMGEEGRATHRTYRRLAEALADAGLLALRFDYDGTGDSAGRQDDPDRVDAWLASVQAARDYLDGLGAPSVAAVGMRLGATLAAAQASASGEPFASLVLWDPCRSGRTFLREGEALHRFGEHGEGTDVPDDGLRHTPGFQYDAATAAAMRGLDLATLPTTTPLAGRTLLLSRDDRPVPGVIEERLAREGDRLTTGAAYDQDRLLDLPPSDNHVPERSLEHVVAWLGDTVSGIEPSPVSAPEREQPVRVPSAGHGSTPVTERSVRFGELGIYGIATEPAGAPTGERAGPRPWVVLVNVAAEHHIGPGRRWVEFARRWAAQGYRCVRLDQSGIGDSPPHPGQVEDQPFAPQWIDDMRTVVDTLAADGSPVVLVGLCSGAYSALEVAMWSSVDSVFAVNPRLTLWPAAKGTSVFTPVRRAAMLPAYPVARLAERRRILAGAIWRIYRQLAVWHAPYLVLRRVVRRGTTVEVVACPDDAQHFTEVVWWRPSLGRLRRRRDFSFERAPVVDHSLLARPAQELVWERATDFLHRRHPVADR